MTSTKDSNKRVKLSGHDGLYVRSNRILLKVKLGHKTVYAPTGLEVTKHNIKLAEKKLSIIAKQQYLGTYDHAEHFPRSKAGKAVADDTSTITVQRVANDWLKLWKSANPLASPHSYSCYKSCIDNHIINIGKLAIGTVTVATLKKWDSELINKKTGEKLSPKRKANIHTTAKQIFLEAQSSGYFSTRPNPWGEFEAWAKSITGKTKSNNAVNTVDELAPLAFGEVERILSITAEYESELNMLGFNFSMGLRLGEVFGLAWDQVDLDKKVIHVTRQFTEGYFKECKSISNRTLALTDDAIRFLKKQQALTYMLNPLSYNFIQDKIGKDKNQLITKLNVKFVFLNPCSNTPYTRSDNFAPRWYKMLEAAKVPSIIGQEKRRRTPNNMRHTFASRLFTNGAPIEYVAQELGNTPGACKRYYARIIKGDQKFNHELKNKYFIG